MNDSYKAALKEAFASCPPNVAVLMTLEFNHESLPAPIYLVNNTEDLNLTLEDGTTKLFEKANFQLQLPEKTDEGIQDLDLKICNVDRRISRFLDNASNFQTKVVCKYRAYLSNDFSQPQNDPPLLLALSDVVANIFAVTAKASFADLVNRKFLNELYTRTNFPSLGG